MIRERGNVTVFVVVAVVFCGLLGLALARLGAAATAKARAETAADAAALAAADAAAQGGSPADEVGAARRSAADNGAVLVRCDCGAREATVVVAFGSARARARAVVAQPPSISRSVRFVPVLRAESGELWHS